MVSAFEYFFGISGLLICSRLLEEEQAHQRISLKEFYIRRAFRILPPALGYLIVIAAIGAIHVIPVSPREWIAALLFYRNYGFLAGAGPDNSWYTVHFWSLALEEHFYLILPAVLVFVSKSWRVRALLLIAVAVIGWRIHIQMTRPNVDWPQHTDTSLDALLIPAILAILLTRLRWRALLGKISRFWFLPAALVIWLVTSGRFQLLSPIAEAVLIPIMLLGTVLHPGGIFSRILELRPLRWIGRISYSLYLWQELLFSGHQHPSYHFLGPLTDFPWRWLALLACAAASYYCLEKPLMRLGHKLAPPDTPGRPDADPHATEPETALPTPRAPQSETTALQDDACKRLA